MNDQSQKRTLAELVSETVDRASKRQKGNWSHRTHFEETFCRTVVIPTHMAAIGRLVAAHYRKRYNGQNPDQEEQEVNGLSHLVNAYSDKDWNEWIEGVVEHYVNNIRSNKL
jgi:hypothetical protein